LLPLPLPGHGDRDLPRFALRLNLHWDFGCWDKWARPSERVLQVRIQPEADDTGIQVDKFVNLPFRQRSQLESTASVTERSTVRIPPGTIFFFCHILIWTKNVPQTGLEPRTTGSEVSNLNDYATLVSAEGERERCGSIRHRVSKRTCASTPACKSHKQARPRKRRLLSSHSHKADLPAVPLAFFTRSQCGVLHLLYGAL
jgi:hypothetical protein